MNENKMVNGVVFEMTDEEQATLNASRAEEQVSLDARAWLDGRLSEYPSVTDQLDMLFWDKSNGTTLWYDMIAEIKTKHPKGQS
jgi:hypothetical protein